MLAKAEILDALRALDAELGRRGVRGELCLYGGAVMCLVYDARPSTRDVDAVFAPATIVREAAERVARDRELPPDWLNDGVKGFVVEHPRQTAFELPHLRVLVPPPDYLLAMKVLAARVDSTDRQDVRFLIDRLSLSGAEDVFRILAQYYPRAQIRPATRFFVEELFDS